MGRRGVKPQTGRDNNNEEMIKMVNALSALTAIVVYARICELGYGNGAAIVCGVCVGTLAHWAYKYIKEEVLQGER